MYFPEVKGKRFIEDQMKSFDGVVPTNGCLLDGEIETKVSKRKSH